MADGEIIIKARVSDEDIPSDLNQVESSIQKKEGSFSGLGSKIGLAFAAAFVAAGGAAIKFGTDFEQGMANASTLFGDAEVSMGDLNTKILDISSSSGVAATDLTAAFTTALSSGIPATDDMAEALTFLEQSTKLAKSGFTTLDSVVDTTTSVLNAYKMNVSDTTRVHEILQKTQDLGKTTVDELGQSLSQVTPTASAMNVSFEQVGAALSVMTAQGIPTAQATTKLNGLFNELGKSGTTGSDALKAAAEGTKYAGKSFTQLMDEGVPLSEVLDLIGESAEEQGLQMSDMFGSIEAGSGALTLSGDNAQSYIEVLGSMGEKTDAVGAAYDKVTNTNAEKFNKAINEGKVLLIEFYEQGLKPMVAALFDAYTWLKENETAMTLIGIAVGTLTVALVAYNISQGLAATGTTLWAAATAALGGAFAFLTSPITLVILAIGALIAIAYLLVTNWEEISAFLTEIWAAISAFFTELWQAVCDWFIALWDGIAAWFQGLLQGISDFFVGIWSGISTWWQDLLRSISEFFIGVWEGIQAFIEGILEGVKAFFMDIWNSLSEENRKWLQGIWDKITEIFNSIKTFFINIWNSIKQFFVDTFAAIKAKAVAEFQAIADFFTSLWNGIKNTATTIFTAIANFFAGIWDSIKNTAVSVWTALTGFISGAWSGIKGAAESVFNALAGFFTNIWSNITGTFRGALSGITGIFGELKNTVSSVWESIKSIFDGIISFIRNVFTGNWRGAWDAVKQIFSGIVSGIGGIFRSPINEIISGINTFIRGLNRIKIPSWVPAVGGLGFNIAQIPSLKVGMDFVPSDEFPAFLHQGEAVLTREEAERWRGNMPRFGAGSFPQLNSLSFAGANQMINRIDLTATIEADGYTLGKVVLRNLDDVRGLN